MSDQSGGSEFRPKVNVKEAIKSAKMQVAEILEGEKYSDLGLEEVRFDTRTGHWVITLGWNRPWNIERQQQTGAGSLFGATTPASSSTTRQIRSFKKIHIDGETGDLLSIEGTD